MNHKPVLVIIYHYNSSVGVVDGLQGVLNEMVMSRPRVCTEPQEQSLTTWVSYVQLFSRFSCFGNGQKTCERNRGRGLVTAESATAEGHQSLHMTVYCAIVHTAPRNENGSTLKDTPAVKETGWDMWHMTGRWRWSGAICIRRWWFIESSSEEMKQCQLIEVVEKAKRDPYLTSLSMEEGLGATAKPVPTVSVGKDGLGATAEPVPAVGVGEGGSEVMRKLPCLPSTIIA